jgi:hypothetical protein
MNLSRFKREAYTIFINNSNYIENRHFCQRKNLSSHPLMFRINLLWYYYNGTRTNFWRIYEHVE